MPSRTPGCIRHEFGKCLGPCIAAAREDEYRGRFREELAAPRNAVQRRALEARIAGILAPGEQATATVPGHEVDEVLLVASWFKRYPDELARTTPFAMEAAVRTA